MYLIISNHDNQKLVGEKLSEVTVKCAFTGSEIIGKRWWIVYPKLGDGGNSDMPNRKVK